MCAPSPTCVVGFFQMVPDAAFEFRFWCSRVAHSRLRKKAGSAVLGGASGSDFQGRAATSHAMPRCHASAAAQDIFLYLFFFVCVFFFFLFFLCPGLGPLHLHGHSALWNMIAATLRQCFCKLLVASARPSPSPSPHPPHHQRLSFHSPPHPFNAISPSHFHHYTSPSPARSPVTPQHNHHVCQPFPCGHPTNVFHRSLARAEASHATGQDSHFSHLPLRPWQRWLLLQR